MASRAPDESRNKKIWLANNWDKIVFPLLLGVVSGVVGYFSGILALQRDITVLNNSIDNDIGDIKDRLKELEATKNGRLTAIERELEIAQDQANEVQVKSTTVSTNLDSLRKTAGDVETALKDKQVFLDTLDEKQDKLKKILESPRLDEADFLGRLDTRVQTLERDLPQIAICDAWVYADGRVEEGTELKDATRDLPFAGFRVQNVYRADDGVGHYFVKLQRKMNKVEDLVVVTSVKGYDAAVGFEEDDVLSIVIYTKTGRIDDRFYVLVFANDKAE